jgi:hypothetical protein
MNKLSSVSGGPRKAGGESKTSKPQTSKKVKYDERSIAAVVDKKIDAKLKAAQEAQTHEAEAEAFIASCLQKIASGELAVPKKKTVVGATTTSSTKAVSVTVLNSILGRAKNSPKTD